jgi:hypothetical protein
MQGSGSLSVELLGGAWVLIGLGAIVPLPMLLLMPWRVPLPMGQRLPRYPVSALASIRMVGGGQCLKCWL